MTRKMKDSGIEWIGEIPEDWEISKFKRYSKSSMGNTIIKSDLLENKSKNSIPVYSATQEDIVFGYIEENNVTVILEKNDLVIPARGNSIGFTKLVSYDKATCTQTTIFSKLNGINPKFIYYCSLAFKDFWFEFDRTAIPQITVQQVENNYIPICSSLNQDKISKLLDKKTKQIEDIKITINKEIEKLENYKKSVITEAVTKGLDKNVEMKDSGIEWIGEIPKSWKVTKVKYIGKLQNGISKNAEYFGKGYPFISYGDVYKNNSLPDEVDGLVESTFSEQALYSVKKGDVFFTRTSETLEEIGYSSVSLKDFEKATFAGFLIRLRPYKSSAILPDYSKYYFRSEHLREYLAKEMTIVTRASLGQQLLNDMAVLLPNIEEQKIIIDYLDKKCELIDDTISIKQKQLEILEEYKKSLIYEYVTGKKEV